MGILCLNRTRQEGESKCDWTLSPGFDCWDPYCCPYDCSKYQGRWNHTHVKLTNNTWVKCSAQHPLGEGCKAVARDRFFDGLYASCQRDNTTSKDHVVRWYQWAWQHSNGTRVTHFRSTTNSPIFCCNCTRGAPGDG
ncbi:hypothetical protein G0U57_000989 [Chelydra serpentina]|uniref:Uncharacterized protein n=1 Tax=Chelydra serpentina TaxID=8475 RepID=A0A8T1SSV0_CHESE|nr:hypothetical protein G0U57_000989 [Chelydra serpentina]